jgi:hypothetical protein
MPLAELIHQSSNKILYICGLIIDGTLIAGQVSLAETLFNVDDIFIFQGKHYSLQVPLSQGFNLKIVTSLKEVTNE